MGIYQSGNRRLRDCCNYWSVEMSTEIQAAETIIQSIKTDFENVSIDKTISFAREAQFAMQILQANDYVRGIALKRPESLRAAVRNVSAIGISLNPAQKQAYLVPRKGEICLDISYMGMMHLAQLSGAILWGQAAIVRKNDKFTMNGIDKAPTHEYDPFATAEDRGEIRGAYVVVKTQECDYLTHTMTKEAIDGIMNRSESVKSGKSSPWKTDYEEMAKKTVVKQAHKYWPRRERLDNAIHYMDTDGGEGIAKEKDVTLQVDEATEKKRADIVEAINKADTLESLADLQVQIKTKLQQEGDGATWSFSVTEMKRRKAEIEAAQ